MIPFWAWAYGRTHDLLDILLSTWAKQDPILPRHKKVPTQPNLMKLLEQNKPSFRPKEHAQHTNRELQDFGNQTPTNLDKCVKKSPPTNLSPQSLDSIDL